MEAFSNRIKELRNEMGYGVLVHRHHLPSSVHNEYTLMHDKIQCFSTETWDRWGESTRVIGLCA